MHDYSTNLCVFYRLTKKLLIDLVILEVTRMKQRAHTDTVQTNCDNQHVMRVIHILFRSP